MKFYLSNSSKRAIKKQSGFWALSILFVLISIIFMALDINNRFVLSDRSNSNELNLQPLKPIKVIQLSSTQLLELNEKYAQFEQNNDEDSDDNKQSLLSQDQQAQQTGELQKFFVGSKSLKLRAILSDINTSHVSYALVEVKDEKSNITALEKILNLESIEGFKLVILSATSVKLSRTLSEKNQQIILTMYRPNIESNLGIK